MDIPSLFMIPSAVSSGKVHSVFPNSTDADFDFNRDSDATRVNSEGLIERVGYYGSELVTNGGFDTDSNWTKGTGWSISNGKASCNGSQSANSLFFQNIGVLGNKTVRFTFTVSNYSAGQLSTSFFGASGTTTHNVTANGEYSFVIDVQSGHNGNSGFTANSSFIGTVDNVSIKEVTGDRARLNYEIEGGLVNTKPSLLLEPQSTNLIPYSNPIEVSGGWQIFDNGSIQTNYEISPMGIKNASLVGTQGGVNDFIFDSITISNSATYTVSFYIKNIDSQATGFYAPSSVDGRINWNGAEISSIVGTGANYEELSNGWYRVHQTTTSTSTNVITRIYSDRVSTGSVLIFGYQLEEQSYPTSLIPTNGSTQTRAAETCNGAGTSSILPSEEGILYAEIAALADDGTFRMLSVSDGTNDNRVRINYSATNGQIQVRLVTGGVTQADLAKYSTVVTSFHKTAIRYKANEVKLYVDGSQVGNTDTSASVPSAGTFDQVNFYGGLASNYFYGKVRDIRVYNTKEMTDSEVDILLTKITS